MSNMIFVVHAFYTLFYCIADLFDVDMEEEVLLTVAVGVVNVEDSAKGKGIKTSFKNKKVLALFLNIALQIQVQRIHFNLSYFRPRFSLLVFRPSP